MTMKKEFAMKKILFVNACVRPDSRTHVLARKALEKLEGQIEEVNLCQEHLLPLNWEMLEERDALISARDFSSPLFQYAKQFAAADDIVIAAPFWELAFPAVLRIYLEHITIVGLTFQYSPEGIPVGLCNAKRIIYVTTAGGAIGGCNLGYDHIKALAGRFYGIQDVVCFKAEMLDIRGADVNGILEESLKEIENWDPSDI